MSSTVLGLLIGATFGLVYVEVNAGALPGPVAVALRVAAAVAYVGLLLVLRREGRHGAGPAGPAVVGFTRGYWLVVAAEVVAFFAGNALLAGPLDRPEAVLPWVTTVVGVHFVALGRVWAAVALARLGAGLTVCGLLGLVLAFSGAGTAAVATAAGVAPGVLLLAGSWWTATAGSRRPTAGSRRPVAG